MNVESTKNTFKNYVLYWKSSDRHTDYNNKSYPKPNDYIVKYWANKNFFIKKL